MKKGFYMLIRNCKKKIVHDKFAPPIMKYREGGKFL